MSIDMLEPGSVGGWAAYPAGVAWALREAGYLSGGADVAIDADLPAGAGLSSSAALGVRSLRRICGHVLAEKRRVLRAAELLRAGGREQVTAIGGLLTASHYSLRDQFEVSWPQADEAVAAAIDAGAAGARMTGGGFGGCVVALVPAARAEQVRGAVTERFARHNWPAPCYLDGVPSDGGRRLR